MTLHIPGNGGSVYYSKPEEKRIRAGTTKYVWMYFACWIVNVVALYGAMAVFWKCVAVPLLGMQLFSSIWDSIVSFVVLFMLLKFRLSLPKPKLENGLTYNFIRAFLSALVRPFWIVAITALIWLIV